MSATSLVLFGTTLIKIGQLNDLYLQDKLNAEDAMAKIGDALEEMEQNASDPLRRRSSVRG